MKIPFPANSSPGIKPQEGGGRLVNGYVTEIQDGGANPVLWERSSGMVEFARVEDADHIGCRAMTLIGSTLLHIVATRVYSVSSAGVVTDVGAFAGTSPVIMAQNTVDPVPDVFGVTDNAAYLFTVGSPPTSYNGGGNLSAPNSVAVLNNYAIFSSPGGRLTATNINSTTIASNAFEDIPKGNLLRVVEYNNELFAFGSNYFRVYRDAGTSPFPLEFTGVERDIGIVSSFAVAGFESDFPDALLFGGSDNRVYRMEGYTAVPVSTHDVQEAIEGTADKSDIRAHAYISHGQPFWSLTSPGNWTWEYNLATGLWHERESYARTDWRGRVTIKAFDKWLVGDAISGNIYEIREGHPFEADDALVWQLESNAVQRFPVPLNAHWSYYNFTSGVGVDTGLIPTQTEPKVAISWSLDGGARYGNPLVRSLGTQGAYEQSVRIGNTGISTGKGIRYRLEVSDGVRVGFMGGQTSLEELSP